MSAVDERATAVPAIPYRGIQSFRYVDHAIFFAREEETLLLSSLVAVYRGVMLYGDSGNGKSSLINAGLLPQVIELGFQVERVRVQPRPGEELVIERIATADDRDGEYLPSLLAPDEADAAARIVLSTEAIEERLRAACASHRLLVVFDQFEEIVTLFDEPGAAELQQHIVDLLVTLLRAPLPVKILLSFREDYLGRVKQLLAAAPELVDQALRLGPMAEAALPAIIRGPFEHHPGHFARELEPPLALRLRDALAERFASGDLSLSEVQTVCLRLWQSDDPQTLLDTRGVQGLLEDYLGEALAVFPADERAAAVALLGQMVTSAGTRNVVAAHDLLTRVREQEDIPERHLVQALARLESESKLVRRERRRDVDIYEITSEFLVPWITERRNEARLQRERRRERRRTAKMIALAGAIVVIVAGAYWAADQRGDARREARASASLALFGAAAVQLESRPDVSLLLALESYRRSPRDVARSSVIAALQAVGGAGELGSLYGHTKTILELAFGPDGRTLASASDDGTVRLWDLRTNRQLGRPLTGHEGPVGGVAFSPDGRMLATSGADGTIRLWDVRTRRPVGRLDGHTARVASVAFSPDGGTLVSAGYDTSVRLWDVRTRRQREQQLEHPKAAFSAVFSPDGSTVATACEDGKIRLWDARSGQPSGVLTGHGAEVAHVAFSRDGATLASAGFDDAVRLWDVRTRRLLRELRAHRKAVYSVAFSPDGSTLVSSSADRTVRRWDVRTYRQLGILASHDGIIRSVVFSPDGRVVASGGTDTQIRIADARSVRGPLRGHTEQVRSVAFSPDGDTLASASTDKTVLLWDVRRHRRIGRLTGHEGSVYAIAFSDDGSLLVSASADRTVRLWDARNGQPVGTPFTGHDDRVRDVAVSHDARMLASGGDDEAIRLWDVRSRRQVGRLPGHDRATYSVAFGPSGTLASGGGDNSIRLWDPRTRRQIGKLVGHTDFVYDVAFSPDGRMLASAGYDNTIRLWDVRTRRQIGDPLDGHIGPVYGVAFSPDGRTVISTSEDSTVRLWDAASRRQIGTLTGHTRPVYSVAVSRNGTIAAGGSDGQIRLHVGLFWGSFAELQATACKLVGVRLSRSEWERYALGVPYGRSCA